MKRTDIPKQHVFFYDAIWKQEMDKMLLNKILMIEQETGIKAGAGVHSPTVIRHAMEDINRVFNKSIGFVDIKNRLVALEGRYDTFQKIMQMSETRWDRELNRIFATDVVWDKIFSENVWAQAYYYSGEPEYNKMCALFGPKHIKMEPTHEVIEIGSTMNTIVISDDDEVSSPVVNVKGKVTRKLCYDDSESSSVPQKRSTGIAPNNLFPPRNSFHSKQYAEVSAPEPNEASSCASCSPFK
ncbi:uncharacterized protein LOC130995880 [Salvia miltiorrhiza]|uniref:uncharacterized protein LOC130995880 n=1 Tax=Salvia miltiorrhiza TaxID=226208 RepID=UPI0025AD8B8A|nr:uncharacterized protein LOC130995880 [Salvia miltiorrhiza]